MGQREHVLNNVWDVNTLSWVRMSQPGGGSPGEGGLTDDELRATPVPVSGTFEVTGSLTDTELRATPVPVSGTVTATGPLTDAQLRATPVPVSGTVATGALTDAQLRAVAVPISGTVSVGTVPVTGTFWQATQPVSGTVTANVGSGTQAVSGTFWQATQPVSAASLPLPTGASTSALQTQPGVDIGDVTVNNAAGAAAVNVQDGGNSLTVDGTVAVSGTVAVTQSGTWDEVGINDSGNSITVDGTFWQATQPVSGTFWQATQPVSGTFWQATQPVSGTVTANAGSGTFATKETRSATPAQSSVSDTASNVTLLASNANRLGATIYNDSTVALYLKLGATASVTSFTVKMAADGYYEVPFGYTGIIDGIWASDASGAARITELT